MSLGDFVRFFIFIAFVALVYCTAARYVILSIRWRRAGFEPPPRNRRVRALTLALAFAGVACILYAYFVEPYWPEVTHVSIRTPRIKPGTSLRIVHISDLHSEARPGLEGEVPALVASQKPDVIVFSGDTLNESAGLPVARRMFAALSATAPVYAVRGNWDRQLDRQLFISAGVNYLERDRATLEVRGNRVYVLGAADGFSDFLPALARSTPEDGFHILLYHRPDEVEKVAAVGNVDLYCAGHTHGGQIALPWFGAIVTFSKLGKKYESGLHRVGNTYLYVNRGLGEEGHRIPRMRFFARPEITVIDVQSE